MKHLLVALLLLGVVIVSAEEDTAIDPAHQKFLNAINRAPWQKKQPSEKKRTVREDSDNCPDGICDPQYTNQWHLNKEFLDLDNPNEGVDMGVQGAWDAGYKGEGVLISFIDDGVQISHPDLSGATRSVCYDFEGGGSDPSKDADHGTSCAGAAVARKNSVCGVGVAYEAEYGGVRLLGAALTTADEAVALTYGLDQVDIYSNSWGPPDYGTDVYPLPPIVVDALEQGVNEGRNGKGVIYMWAGGNGDADGDSCEFDGYVASQYTIPIGAVDQYGKKSYYSESCAALLAVTTSSGDTLGITTTDRTPPKGFNPDSECTNDFSGTSAATPMGSGVVALMLQANPELTWRDVKGVLIHTAVKTDEAHTDWKENGAGLLYNPSYGFGLLNASRAVDLALTWENVGPYTLYKSATTIIHEEIPAGDVGFVQEFTVGSEAIASDSEPSKVEYAVLTVDLDHPARNNLTITLTSPAGTVALLATPHLQGQIPTLFLVINGYTYEFPGAGMGFGTVYDQEGSGELFFVYGCNQPSKAVSGKVVMVRMDQESCTPYEQFLAIQNAGATGVVFVPDYEGPFQDFDGPTESDGDDSDVIIPVMQITRSLGEQIMDPSYRLEGVDAQLGTVEHIQKDYENYPFGAIQFWGENGEGVWKVEITEDDDVGAAQGVVNSLQLTLYGEGFAVKYEYEPKSHLGWVKITLIAVACALAVAVAVLVGLYYYKTQQQPQPMQDGGFGRLEEEYN